MKKVGCGMRPSQTKLGSFVRNRRLQLKLGQVQLARQAGICQTSVSNLEIGTRKYLTEALAQRLAVTLHCDPRALCRRAPKKPQPKTPTTKIGKIIRTRREEIGMTLETFARAMNMTVIQAKSLEIRRRPVIACRTAKAAATALKMEISELTKFVKRPRASPTQKFGLLIRSRRIELGMTSVELAGALGVSPQFINQVELGDCTLTARKSRATVERLVQILNIDSDELEANKPTRRSLK